MQSNMIQVQEYFQCHLQRRHWQNLPADTQSAAVKMAEDDIKLALNTPTLDIGDLLVFCAVCEQALYLALQENCRSGESTAHGALKSESIDGIGKREYYERSVESESVGVAASGVLTPRCELFLYRLPGYGEIKINRG